MPETAVHFQIHTPPVPHERLASRACDEKSSLNTLFVVLSDVTVARGRRDASGRGGRRASCN